MNHKITSISTLSGLVNQDKKEHLIKHLADLFLTAMLDWPSMNQIEIAEFKNELKEYFGEPLNIETLADAKLDKHTTHYWWRRESATSLIKMLQLSQKEGVENDFDAVVDTILKYYENDLRSSQ